MEAIALPNKIYTKARVYFRPVLQSFSYFLLFYTPNAFAAEVPPQTSRGAYSAPQPNICPSSRIAPCCWPSIFGSLILRLSGTHVNQFQPRFLTEKFRAFQFKSTLLATGAGLR